MFTFYVYDDIDRNYCVVLMTNPIPSDDINLKDALHDVTISRCVN